jgi:phosphatidylglycerol:prolipoprotein diacylglycerol transferase
MFLVGYGVFRSFAEFFREPDDGFMGILTLGISMGQWLSLPMIVAGVLMIVWVYRTPSAAAPTREIAEKARRPAAARKRNRQ